MDNGLDSEEWQKFWLHSLYSFHTYIVFVCLELIHALPEDADILGMTLDFLQTTNTFDRIGQYFIVPSGVVQRYVKYGILILMKAVSNI